VSANAVEAATYYIAPTGNDAISCATATVSSTPKRTIGNASGCLVAGDTLMVLPGTYTVPGEIVTSRSGTAVARIRYVSSVKWGAKILGTTTTIIWRNTGQYVDIEGFDFSAAPGAAAVVGIAVYNLGSHVRLVNNHVHDFTGDGAGLDSAAADDAGTTYLGEEVDVIGNVIHDLGNLGQGLTCSRCVHGIYMAHKKGRVQNNLVYRVSGEGITTYHGATDCIISNNLVFRADYDGIRIAAGNGPPGVIHDNSIISNNIVIDSRIGIWEGPNTGPNNRFLNNISFNNVTANIIRVTGSQSGNLFVDPVLVNYRTDGTGDYHLASGSPAIDAGTSVGAPFADLDGNPRPIGSSSDIGPYEYGSGGGPAAPTGLQVR
jgi:hypothetical protein